MVSIIPVTLKRPDSGGAQVLAQQPAVCGGSGKGENRVAGQEGFVSTKITCSNQMLPSAADNRRTPLRISLESCAGANVAFYIAFSHELIESVQHCCPRKLQLYR
jgi:hypothetical protein